MKNDKIAAQIESNPNDLFIERNVKDCFKKDKEIGTYGVGRTKPVNVLKSLEYISEMSRKGSTTSEATKTNENEGERVD